MFEVFFGSDEVKVRAAAFAAATAFGLSPERLEADTYQPGQLANLCEAVSLFGGSQVYLLDTPSVVPEWWAEVSGLKAALAASPHTFVMIDGTLSAAQKTALVDVSQQEFKASAKLEFNTFALADALASKDKRSLWLLLCAAKATGRSAEELIGVLWWQLKTLRLAALTKSANEAGLKDFPYNKAKRALVNFKPGELETLSSDLLLLYHDGHSGEREIDLALEEWVLRMA